MDTQEENPFKSPAAVHESRPATGREYLASRGTRFWAQLLDGLIVAWFMVPIGLMTGYIGRAWEASTTETIQYAVASHTLYLLLNGYLLATRGQSVGKRLLHIQIVDYTSGKLLPFGRLLAMRLLPVWIVGVIPFVGDWLRLLDVLLITGGRRRCLHDLIAGSKVVEV